MKKTIALLLMSSFILSVNAQQDSTRRRQTPIDPSTLPAKVFVYFQHDLLVIWDEGAFFTEGLKAS